MNGGNGGCMEAMAMGCKKVENGCCEGVIVPNDLPVECNPYLTKVTKANNMFDRLDILYNQADVIVALPGYLGTLNEILMSITLNYITDENKRAKKPIFISQNPWEPIWKSICDELEVRLIVFCLT